MHRKLLITTILITFLSVSLFLLVRSLNTQEKGTKIVELTNDGFIPKVLEVIKGDKVVFKSRLKNPFWPVSYPYAINNIKPLTEFGSPIISPDTFSAHFNQIGEWHYFNKAGPRYSKETGTIIIRDKVVTANKRKEMLPKDYKECQDRSQDKISCLEDLIRYTLKSKKISEAFRLFGEIYNSDTEFSRSCNEFARKMGGIAFRYLGNSGKNYLFPELSACNYGYYIGYLDAMSVISGNLKEQTLFCNTVRQKFNISNPHSYLECLKGLSQTIIRHYDFDGNWQAQIKEASSFCRNNTQDIDELNICKVGIFSAFTTDLQNFLVDKFGANISPDNIKDPFQYCRVINDEDKPQCYGAISAWMIWSGIFNFNSAVSLTINITDKEFAVRTIRALAKISISKSDEKPEKLINDCKSLRKELSKQCLISLIQGKMELGKPGKEYEDGFNFCKSKFFPNEDRELCIKFVLFETELVQANKANITEICKVLDKNYQNYCLDYHLNFFQL